MKVVRLSALFTSQLYPPGNIPGNNFCYRIKQPHSHSVAGRIVSMKNSNDTIRNRTHDLHKNCKFLILSWQPPGWSVPTVSSSSLKQLNNFQLAPKYSHRIINTSIIFTVLWEQWLKYSDACWFSYTLHSKWKQTYYCDKPTSTHIVPELQQNEKFTAVL
jgi:hypothetical protein